MDFLDYIHPHSSLITLAFIALFFYVSGTKLVLVWAANSIIIKGFPIIWPGIWNYRVLIYRYLNHLFHVHFY